jgi:Phage integrase, N-terminal SAM-like domain
MRQVLRLKHMSIRTEEMYMGWVRRFILFHHKRHPKEMGTEEIREFLTHLAVLAVDAMHSLRVQEAGFAYQQLMLRHGEQDCITMLPKAVQGPLKRHLSTVERLHQGDAAESYEEMYLPYASAEVCETTEAHARVNQLREKIYASESSSDARASWTLGDGNARGGRAGTAGGSGARCGERHLPN